MSEDVIKFKIFVDSQIEDLQENVIKITPGQASKLKNFHKENCPLLKAIEKAEGEAK